MGKLSAFFFCGSIYCSSVCCESMLCCDVSNGPSPTSSYFRHLSSPLPALMLSIAHQILNNNTVKTNFHLTLLLPLFVRDAMGFARVYSFRANILPMYGIPIKFARIRYYCIIYTMYSTLPYLQANFCYSFLISFIWMNCVTEYFPAFLALH